MSIVHIMTVSIMALCETIRNGTISITRLAHNPYELNLFNLNLRLFNLIIQSVLEHSV